MWNSAQNQPGPHQCVCCFLFILKNRDVNHYVCMFHVPAMSFTSFNFSCTTNTGFVEYFTSLRQSFKSHSLTYWDTLFPHTRAFFIQLNLIHSIMAEDVIMYLKSSAASPESQPSPSASHKRQRHRHVNIWVPFKQEHHSPGKTAGFKHLEHYARTQSLLHLKTCFLHPSRCNQQLSLRDTNSS